MNKTGLLERAQMALNGFARMVLSVDDSSSSLVQMSALEDYLCKFDFDTENVSEVSELLKVLLRKHFVDFICVSSANGNLIASSNGQDLSEALTGTALLNYVQSEIPKSSVLMVKSNGWYMVFPYKKKIFIIKALDSLSMVEMHAIAKEVELFLLKK